MPVAEQQIAHSQDTSACVRADLIRADIAGQAI